MSVSHAACFEADCAAGSWSLAAPLHPGQDVGSELMRPWSHTGTVSGALLCSVALLQSMLRDTHPKHRNTVLQAVMQSRNCTY